MKEERSPVAIPCVGYDNMSQKWDLLDDLLGGTAAMREAGTKWLPREPGEELLKYDARLNRSVLFCAYGDTLNKLSNKPFSRPMTIENLPEELQYLLCDVDSTGTSMEAFTQEILYNLLKHGVVHIFVDHSQVPGAEEATKADEAEAGARVLLVCVPASNMLGWQTRLVGKKTVLSQIRMLETRIEPVGDYGDQEVNYIRVVSEEAWELWKQDKDKKDKWDKIDTGIHTFGRIPLITLYADRTGYMTADPPMEDLAWMNLVHWQSYSDQRNILRFSRFALLFGKGMPKEFTEAELQLGPTRAFMADDPNADMKYVEHTGKGIEAGAKDLEDIESKMELLGNMPLVKQQKKLATSVRIDSDRNFSQLQAWIRALETAIEDALKLACEWRKITPAEDMSVDIFSDFETVMLGSSDADFVLKARQAGELSQETFIREIKRRGKLADSVDVQEEIDRISNEITTDLEPFMEQDEDGEEDDSEPGITE